MILIITQGEEHTAVFSTVERRTQIIVFPREERATQRGPIKTEKYRQDDGARVSGLLLQSSLNREKNFQES